MLTDERAGRKDVCILRRGLQEGAECLAGNFTCGRVLA